MTPAGDGLLLVDKPAGWTSHDVVARVRRLAGIRRVGHAGTLDPPATGLLVIGIGRATRLLGLLALHDKDYDATIQLGTTTTTEDADGDVIATVDASHVSEADIRAAMQTLTGEIDQVPSAVSAVKVGGQRAYARVRAGEHVELAPRRVTVHAFELAQRNGDSLDVRVRCSTGTYVRALARDLGGALSVGAHVRSLRRTRVGGYTVDVATPLDRLGVPLPVIPLSRAVADAFPRRDVDAATAAAVAHGARLAPTGSGRQAVGVFGPDGEVLALVEERDGAVHYLAVFA